MNPGNEPQKRRRRSKVMAWYWKQTDAWYWTPSGTKQRVPLCDERGQRIHGVVLPSICGRLQSTGMKKGNCCTGTLSWATLAEVNNRSHAPA